MYQFISYLNKDLVTSNVNNLRLHSCYSIGAFMHFLRQVFTSYTLFFPLQYYNFDIFSDGGIFIICKFFDIL